MIGALKVEDIKVSFQNFDKVEAKSFEIDVINRHFQESIETIPN